MATNQPDEIPPVEERAGERSDKAGEGNFGRAFMLGSGMFLPVVIVLLIGLAVILFFVIG